MSVNIRGKEYITVNERVQAVHKDNDILSITTELVSSDPVLFKATVVVKKGTFTGYSASYGNPQKYIEKQSPYEVAETSAVGRALGFAGYGIVESIASADEIVKAKSESVPEEPDWMRDEEKPTKDADEKGYIHYCGVHQGEVLGKKFSEKKQKYYWSHRLDDGSICFGH